MYPTTNKHSVAFQKKNQSNQLQHQMREAFLSTNRCKIHRQYFLKLFFLHFEYFQIRQLENLGAKRRTPLARNFSHFKKKESEVFRDLANPQFFQYLCTAISNPVSKSVFCYNHRLKEGGNRIKQILKVKQILYFGNDSKFSTCSYV